MMDKFLWREKFKNLRKNLSQERRQEAAKNIHQSLKPLLEKHPFIVSFASLPTEIGMDAVNRPLA